MNYNMKQWIQAQIHTGPKKPLPLLSFPCIQMMGISVRELISDSALQANGMALVAGYSFWIFFVPLIAFLVVLYIWRIVALASILSAVVNTAFIWFYVDSLPLFITSLIFTVILIVRHRPNLQRMLNGTENKIKWMG